MQDYHTTASLTSDQMDVSFAHPSRISQVPSPDLMWGRLHITLAWCFPTSGFSQAIHAIISLAHFEDWLDYASMDTHPLDVSDEHTITLLTSPKNA